MRNEYNGIDITTGAFVEAGDGELNKSKLMKSTFNILRLEGQELDGTRNGVLGLTQTLSNVKSAPALDSVSAAIDYNNPEVKLHLKELTSVLKNSPELEGNKLNFIIRKHSYDNNSVGNFNETMLFVHNPKNDVIVPLTRVVHPENGSAPEFASVHTPTEPLTKWFKSFVNFQAKNESVKLGEDLTLSDVVYQTELDETKSKGLRFMKTDKLQPEMKAKKVADMELELAAEHQLEIQVESTMMAREASAKTLNDIELNEATFQQDLQSVLAQKSLKGMPRIGQPGFRPSLLTRMKTIEQNRENDKLMTMYSDIYNRNNASVAQKLNSGSLTPEHIHAHGGYAMYLAANTGNRDGLETLLENGGNPNAVDVRNISDPNMQAYVKKKQDEHNHPILSTLGLKG